MTRLEINETLYLLPSKWNELTREQLLEFCRIQLLETTEDYRKFLMLSHLTGLKFKQLEAIPGGALPRVMSCLNFLFQDIWLTINLFGDIGAMKSPEPALTNFTFAQFLGETEPYFYSIQTGKWNDVDNLINSMYNFNGPAENKKIISAMTDAEKLAIMTFYNGCSNFIKKKFPAVFTKSETKTKPDGLEFVRLVNSLNLNDVSKNEAIKNSNLYEALTFLQGIINKNVEKKRA